MELALQIHVEQLADGIYLATSDELPGLAAQGRTVAETLEIASDVARKLIEARREREGISFLPAGSPTQGWTQCRSLSAERGETVIAATWLGL